MEITRALEVFGFKSLDEVTAEELKRKYRKAARENHPDLASNKDKEQKEKAMKEFNGARDLLDKLLLEINQIAKIEQSTKRADIFALIPFQSLIDIYNGKEITVKSRESSEIFKLTKSNIKAHRIIICFECSILVNGFTYTYSGLKPANYKDEYELTCNVPITPETENSEVIVKAYGKEVRLALKNKTTRLKLKYDNCINLTVEVVQSLISNDS